MLVNKLSAVSSISPIRRIEPTTPPGTRVRTAPASERGRNSRDVYYLDTRRLDADPKMRFSKVTSADLLNSMIRQMGGAMIPSAKGSYVDFVV